MPQILLLLLLSVKRRRRYINREKARNLTTIFDGVIPSHGAGAVAEERGCGHRQVSGWRRRRRRWRWITKAGVRAM
jgi:hypothetical protein